MSKNSLLVVDDHEHILKQLFWALADEFDVYTAPSREAALETLRRVHPQLLTVDLALTPGGKRRQEGFDVLQAALHLDPMIKAVVITSDQEEETALEAVRRGAFDYFVKPVPPISPSSIGAPIRVTRDRPTRRESSASPRPSSLCASWCAASPRPTSPG